MYDGLDAWESDEELGESVPDYIRKMRSHLGGENVLIADGHVEVINGKLDYKKIKD